MIPENIPKEMKAVQVVEYKKPWKLETIPVPSDLQPQDILVKVAIASICHTDSMVRDGIFETKLPCTASHEGSGTIVALGEKAKECGFETGQRIMCGIPFHPCGECYDCTGPETFRQYCQYIEGHNGVHTPGYLAEYARLDSANAVILPDQVTFSSAAPLACAGRTVWRAVIQTNLQSGQTLAIVGSGGGLGHIGIQFAKSLGLRVIGIDAREDGLAISKENRADFVFDASKGKASVVEDVHGVTSNVGVDATICLSDHKDAAAISCAITKMHSEVILVAQPNHIIIPFQEFIFRDIRVRGSLLCSKEETENMLKIVVEHSIKVKKNQFNGLDKTGELIKLVESGKLQGKAMIVVDPEQIKHEQEIGAKY